MFYWINVYGGIEESEEPLKSIEGDLKAYGNYFTNKEVAISARNKIYTLLKQYASAKKDPMGEDE